MQNIKEKTVDTIVNETPDESELQQSVIQKPYIEVQLIPGENSNRTMLGFDYAVNMPSDTEVEVVVKFEHPEYVSSTQPSDQLEITFWGPFFDQEDGLLM